MALPVPGSGVVAVDGFGGVAGAAPADVDAVVLPHKWPDGTGADVIGFCFEVVRQVIDTGAVLLHQLQAAISS